MSYQHDLPWMKINDYLYEAGTAKDREDFCSLALNRIDQLIPFDANGIFGIIDVSGSACIQSSTLPNDPWGNLFHQHYWKVVPNIGMENITSKIVNWQDYHHTEYVTDFLRPQRICQSIGIMNLGRCGHFMGGLVINRSSSKPDFTERELQILSFIQPHLSNLFHLYSLLGTQQNPLIDAPDLRSVYPTLTQREAEVSVLICQGLNTELISSSLFISPRTVHKHIENIFLKLHVRNRQELLVKINRIRY